MYNPILKISITPRNHTFKIRLCNIYGFLFSRHWKTCFIF